MQEILQKIYKQNSEQASQDIYNLYKSKGQAIVNYIYGANIIKNDLLEANTAKPLKQVLLDGDFLLPDGAALRTFWKIGYKFGGLKRIGIAGPNSLANINGTDFLPYMINDYIAKLGKEKVKLAIYGSKKEFQNNIKKYIDDNFGVELLYIQDGYSDFDWSAMSEKSEKISEEFDKDLVKIFIVAMGTPKQEIWSYANRDKLKGFMVMSQGGTMDFWAGFETRAPGRIRALWLESIYRLITKPKKNFAKFMVSFAMMWEIVKRWMFKL